MSTGKKIEWSPWDIFQRKPGSENYAVLILNQPVHFHGEENSLIVQIWNSAKVRVTVDGGTDRWLKWKNDNSLTDVLNPHLVTGDMDSITPQTLEYFQNQSDVQVIFTKDQDNTDFTKALIELNKHINAESIKLDTILVVCEMSGRFDHTVSNVNTLFNVEEVLPKGIKLFIMSHMNMTWFLEGGNTRHEIVVPKMLIDEDRHCGLVPFGKYSISTTSGLKWNLDNQKMEFGELVSTSNGYESEKVIVQADNPLVFTMEITGLLKIFNRQ